MKTVYVKFKDLKAYHMYYWVAYDSILFVEYSALKDKGKEPYYYLNWDEHFKVDGFEYIPETDYFVELGKL